MTESENIQDRFKLNKYIAVIYDAFSYYAKLSPERAECIFLGLHGVGEETIGDIIIFSPDGDHQRAREAFEDVEGLLIETCRYIHGLQVVNGPAEGQIITSLKSLLNHFINPDQPLVSYAVTVEGLIRPGGNRVINHQLVVEARRQRGYPPDYQGKGSY